MLFRGGMPTDDEVRILSGVGFDLHEWLADQPTVPLLLQRSTDLSNESPDEEETHCYAVPPEILRDIPILPEKVRAVRVDDDTGHVHLLVESPDGKSQTIMTFARHAPPAPGQSIREYEMALTQEIFDLEDAIEQAEHELAERVTGNPAPAGSDDSHVSDMPSAYRGLKDELVEATWRAERQMGRKPRVEEILAHVQLLRAERVMAGLEREQPELLRTTFYRRVARIIGKDSAGLKEWLGYYDAHRPSQ